MATSTYTLQIIQGSSLNLLVTATDQNSVPIVLSGWNIRGYIKSKYSESGVLLNLNPTIYSAISGIVQINVSGSQTSSLPVGEFPYDLEAENSNASSTIKFLVGYCQISPEVSNL